MYFYGGLIAFLITSYLFGSIPFGYILTKAFHGTDIRQTGSGNIGATNVLRSGRETLAVATLFLDCLKPIIPIFGGMVFYSFVFTYDGLSMFSRLYLYPPQNFMLTLALLAIIGHCYPVWLKFKGGKGVATALGGLLAAVPYAGLAACGVWLVTAFLFQYSSLAALVAVAVAPVVTFFVYGAAPAGICALITLLVFWRHRENIARLIKGEESKISFKKKEERGGSVSE